MAIASGTRRERENSTRIDVERADIDHSTGTTRLKMWAEQVLKNTISNILSVGAASLFAQRPVGVASSRNETLRERREGKENRFTHIFSLVTPLRLPRGRKSRIS